MVTAEFYKINAEMRRAQFFAERRRRSVSSIGHRRSGVVDGDPDGRPAIVRPLSTERRRQRVVEGMRKLESKPRLLPSWQRLFDDCRLRGFGDLACARLGGRGLFAAFDGLGAEFL